MFTGISQDLFGLGSMTCRLKVCFAGWQAIPYSLTMAGPQDIRPGEATKTVLPTSWREGSRRGTALMSCPWSVKVQQVVA